MVEGRERMRWLTFREQNAQLLGGAATEDRPRSAWSGVAAGEHLTGVRVGGQTAGIDAVAVVLSHQLLALMINPDQEIARWIQGDEALRKAGIEGSRGITKV